MTAKTPRRIGYPLPEGADPAELATRAAEQGIDSMVALDWPEAQRHFADAAHYCAEAYAVRLKEEAAQMKEQGYAPCGHCGAWAWPDDMYAIPAGYTKKGAVEMPETAYRCCAECWEKIK